MYLSTALALASSAGLASAHPFRRIISRDDVTAFPAGQSWDILLAKGDTIGNVKSAVDDSFQVLDIDLFDTDKQTISDLKATKQVICYFSAGSREGWRPDAGDFKDGDTGKGLDGWPDELWVNVQSENVKNIMKKRIQKAKEDGCSAIDPDNVDGFDGGQDGFGYQKDAYVQYVKFLAQEAKNAGLAIGLKNAVDMIPDVVDVMDFAVNEQCHEYDGECAKYKPFTDQNKAVFNIEYGGNHCDSPAGVKLSTVIKSEDQALNQLGGACVGQGAGTPTTGGNQPSQSSPTKSGNQNSHPSAPITTAVPVVNPPAPTQGGIQPRPTGSYPGGQEPEEGEGENEAPGNEEEEGDDDEDDVPAKKEEGEDNENEDQTPSDEQEKEGDAPNDEEEEDQTPSDEQDEGENEDQDENDEEDEPAPPSQTGYPSGRPTGRPGQQHGWGYGHRSHRSGGRNN